MRQTRRLWNSGNPQVEIFSKGWFDCEKANWSDCAWRMARRVRDWMQQPDHANETARDQAGRNKAQDSHVRIGTERASGAGVALQRRLLLLYGLPTPVSVGEPSRPGRRSEGRDRENSSEPAPPIRLQRTLPTPKEQEAVCLRSPQGKWTAQLPPLCAIGQYPRV